MIVLNQFREVTPMYDIAVIGAGASGIVAAISAKKTNNNISVALIEALPKIGKKILATGNGRCNLTNLTANAKSYNTKAVSAVMEACPPKKIVEFFSSIGLECVTDSESRVYPMSNTATGVLDCLRFEADRLGIDVITDTKISSVRKNGRTFIINDSIECRKVIVSTGGKAAPSQGSDGSGYPIIKSLGHTVTQLYPGLVQITVKENLKFLKGIRVKAAVSLKDKNGRILDKSEGEVLFADYGLSGIAIMDVSRSAKDQNCICSLDILSDMKNEAVYEFIVKAKKRNPSLLLEDALCGILPKKVGYLIIKNSGFRQDITLRELKNEEINKFIYNMKNCIFTVTGTRGFDSAQITVGGASFNEFDTKTLESKIAEGLYCTGELLDVDAPCGGFNLQWAWASGIVAGTAAAYSLTR